MSDTKLLDIAERVSSTKAELDAAELGANYYRRVLAEAESRVQVKLEAFQAALCDMRLKGGV